MRTRARRLLATALTCALAPGAARALTAEEILNYKGPDREKLLIEGARAEGQATIYSSLTINQMMRPLAEAFQKKYPFVKLNYWRAESANIFTKLSAEARAGNVVADVVEGTGVGEAVVQAGFTQAWSSPALDELPSRYLDPNRMWAPTRRSFYSAAYNTRLTPEDAAPKTYDDLLDPRWKGRIFWHVSTSSGAPLFITNLRLAWGEDRALDYLKRLAAQRVVNMTAGSGRLLVDRVMAGEIGLALNIFAHHPVISRAKGASVNSAMLDPVASTVGTMAFPKGLRHPHAAMLLADFFLSREGQKILSDAEYFPVREDTPTKPGLAPIIEAVARSKENFISPETLVKFTPSSEQIIQDWFR